MSLRSSLNPMVFVKNENDPEFRAYILRRAREATDPKNRSKNLSVTEAKALLAARRRKFTAHG